MKIRQSRILYCIVFPDTPLHLHILFLYCSTDEYGVSIERRTVKGDTHAKSVLACLTDIALLYGDQFIFQQYFPFIHETVSCCFGVRHFPIQMGNMFTLCIGPYTLSLRIHEFNSLHLFTYAYTNHAYTYLIVIHDFNINNK